MSSDRPEVSEAYIWQDRPHLAFLPSDRTEGPNEVPFLHSAFSLPHSQSLIWRLLVVIKAFGGIVTPYMKNIELAGCERETGSNRRMPSNSR